jgi:tRNA(Ile)-lysidine synthase TilS/MesJ
MTLEQQSPPYAVDKTGPKIARVAALVALTEQIETLDAHITNGALGSDEMEAARRARRRFVDIYADVAGVPYITVSAGGRA